MVLGNPEMKSYIWLQTMDGPIQQVEEEVAMLCPMIRQEVLKNRTGFSKTHALSLSDPIKFATYELIFDYCQCNLVPIQSRKEHKTFDEKFIRMDFYTLCELFVAAENLQLKPLIDLCFQTVDWIVQGKTSEEIREIFGLSDVFTEDEKLAPLINFDGDPRIRVLNRLYAIRRKELKERQKLMNVELVGDFKDERSIDDLLSFINGEDGEGTRASKNKNKNRRKKDRAKGPSKTANDNMNKVSNPLLECRNDNFDIASDSSPSKYSRMQDLSGVKISPNFDFKDEELNDDLDPELKEKLDREIEEFERILNTKWPDRVQEVLSLSQDSVLLSILVNDKRCTHFNTSN